jgi:hypothetical protein
LHVLVEGPSEEALAQGWLPRLLPRHAFTLIRHRGKGRLSGDPLKVPDVRREGLLDQLPAKLRAYGQALNPATDRVVVLVDLDDDDCLHLKKRLVALLDHCDPKPYVLFRIAIEETESFYLGDPGAIRSAFPQAKLQRMKDYVQDSICGTWELFQRVVDARSEDKVGWAEQMGRHLGTEWRGRAANRSPSFQQLCQGLLRAAGEPVE